MDKKALDKFYIKVLSKKLLKKGNGKQLDFLQLKVECLSENFKEIYPTIQNFKLTLNCEKSYISKKEEFYLYFSYEELEKHLINSSMGYQMKMPFGKILYKTKDIDDIAIKTFLKKNVSGIGDKKATAIINRHGDNIIDVVYENYLDEDVMALEFPMLNGTQIKELSQILLTYDNFNNISLLLKSIGVSKNYQNEIYSTFGDESVKVFLENPFLLSNILDKEDFLLYLHNKKFNTNKIINSIIDFQLREDLKQGNTIIEENILLKRIEDTISLYELKLKSYKNAIKKELKSFNIIQNEKGTFYQKHEIANEELFIAQKIQTLKYNDKMAVDNIKLDTYFNKEQKEAILTTLKEPFSIITGGAGVGKTTVLKEIINQALAKKLISNVVLLAPTGKAAQRMNESINSKAFEATTIHKRIELIKRGLLRLPNSDEELSEFDKSNAVTNLHSENTLNIDIKEIDDNKPIFYIIDESAMANGEIFYELFRSIEDNAKVLLVGDVNQLDAIGYGAVFKDIIESNVVPVSRLITKVRQGKDINALTTLIDSIENREFSNFIADGKTFSFININSYTNELLNLSLFNSLKNKAFAEQTIQALSPLNIGVLGNNDINLNIINKIEQESNSLSSFNYHFQTFIKYMPVIVTENNKELGVLNGMTGYIVDIVEENNKKIIEVHLDHQTMSDDNTLFIEENIKLLAPSYSISIHKSQGSEYEKVILILPDKSDFFLNFNLIYTAATRAKKELIIIGSEKVIQKALKVSDKRITGLQRQIKLCNEE